ncbi:DUF1801 domain-containing protein [Sphingomicrobium nitratireducens]|uniref:DUF1801 domain-containing protein n=1 Tax=Sphingomicrobium nitratireducens TaxID=2964666 RepID=UPI00223EA80C|nr:DUF1801 domain-containing protein [Sphingomicrobium nitratireducens]
MVSSKATTVADYLAELPDERRAVISDIRDRVNAAIPAGYRETMAWGMITWEVPLEVSGPTYNKKPLMYAALAAQKNHNALYLTCAYAEPERYARLEQAFEEAGLKFDMGKSCLRFKGAEELAWDAIADELATSSPEEFVAYTDEARASGRRC